MRVSHGRQNFSIFLFFIRNMARLKCEHKKFLKKLIKKINKLKKKREKEIKNYMKLKSSNPRWRLLTIHLPLTS